MKTEDIPFSLSPEGITNIPVGSSARPASMPLNQNTWAWDTIKTVTRRGHGIWINDTFFAFATGHISIAEIKALATLSRDDRVSKIGTIMQRWFRPYRLRRLHRIVMLRTDLAATTNAYATVIAAAISLFLVSNGLDILPESTASTIAASLPLALVMILCLHVLALVVTWINGRKLIRWGAASPSSILPSVALFPPQSLQLRATLADTIWPATHPLTAAVAFSPPADLAPLGSNTWRDLQWPLAAALQPGLLSTEIARWHRTALAPMIDRLLRDANIDPATALVAPTPDSPESCAYCPRCQDQFVRPDGQCPHGIALMPLNRLNSKPDSQT
jgi:hypothetical protein